MKNRILAAKMAMVSLLVIILSVTGTPSFAQGRTSGDAVTVSELFWMTMALLCQEPLSKSRALLSVSILILMENTVLRLSWATCLCSLSWA